MKRPQAVVLMGVMAVVAAGLLLWFVLWLSSDPEAQNQLGDPVFEIGDAEGVAAAVERHGPLLVADPLRRGRNLVVDRAGGRWQAYAVRPSGPRCRVEVDRETKAVTDSCTGPLHDVAGLPHYATRVTDDGELQIDLRREVDPEG